MRRTVLVPTVVAAMSRARHMLLAVSLAALLALALIFPAPVAAQGRQVESGDEQAETSSCTTSADEVATFTTKDTSFGPFRIVGESFDVLYEAQTDRDSGSFKVAVTEDGETVVETAEITVLPVDDVLKVEDEGPGSFSLDVVADGGVDFAITVCEAGGTQGAGDDGGTGATDDGTENTDDLQDLGCEDLLVLFRGESSSGQQYEDSAVFADSEVRAQVEVCLKKEIVEGTAADENLPDTGGLSLLALAVLGVVSAAAGLSVIRGGQR